MVNMANIETLVDGYVTSWGAQRPNYSGLWEDNDFGWENQQIFRNNFNLEDFTHDELSRLAVLLTRQLRGQINRDHKLFWAWSGMLVSRFRNVPLFMDLEWRTAFTSLISLILAKRRSIPQGQSYQVFSRNTGNYVNHHLMMAEMNKWQIAGPLAFSIFEGLLRRKCNSFVDDNGTALIQFSVTNRGRTRTFRPNGSNYQKYVNRIYQLLLCFEQNVVTQRARTCSYLQDMNTEIQTLYPNVSNVYDTLDEWRNNLMHGKEFWQNRAPIIANLICLLAIDEIVPNDYDAERPNLSSHVQWTSQNIANYSRAPWDFYPPDL